MWDHGTSVWACFYSSQPGGCSFLLIWDRWCLDPCFVKSKKPSEFLGLSSTILPFCSSRTGSHHNFLGFCNIGKTILQKHWDLANFDHDLLSLYIWFGGHTTLFGDPPSLPYPNNILIQILLIMRFAVSFPAMVHMDEHQ